MRATASQDDARYRKQQGTGAQHRNFPPDMLWHAFIVGFRFVVMVSGIFAPAPNVLSPEPYGCLSPRIDRRYLATSGRTLSPETRPDL
jgi:hypothetical protein